jgi:hypothetical protein
MSRTAGRSSSGYSLFSCLASGFEWPIMTSGRSPTCRQPVPDSLPSRTWAPTMRRPNRTGSRKNPGQAGVFSDRVTEIISLYSIQPYFACAVPERFPSGRARPRCSFDDQEQIRMHPARWMAWSSFASFDRAHTWLRHSCSGPMQEQQPKARQSQATISSWDRPSPRGVGFMSTTRQNGCSHRGRSWPMRIICPTARKWSLLTPLCACSKKAAPARPRLWDRQP